MFQREELTRKDKESVCFLCDVCVSRSYGKKLSLEYYLESAKIHSVQLSGFSTSTDIKLTKC